MPSELTASVLLRLKPDERERLNADAQAAGLSVNNYARAKLVGGEPTSTPAYNTLATRVETLETAARIKGWGDAITQAQSLLGRKE